jgi:hypothetical protein
VNTQGIVGETGGLQPFGVVILFMAITYNCLSLNATGFFGWVAGKMVRAFAMVQPHVGTSSLSSCQAFN